MLDFKNIITNSNYEYNEFYLDRYLKFIDWIKTKDRNNVVECELHHILPRSMFKEYIKDRNNLILLSYREHYLAHFMLYKCFYKNIKMIFSFNMMNNFYSGRNYQKLRTQVVQLISKNNKGRKMSTKNKEMMSRIHKNKVCVRDKKGNKFKVDINDIRLLNGELINNLVGTKHNKNTIDKMLEHSNKNKKAYNNGKITKFLTEPTEEFCNPGYDPATCKYIQKQCCDMYWYYNEETGETIRIKSYETPPIGFIRKRVHKGKFRGAGVINDTYTKVLDIRDKKIKGIKKEDYDEEHHFFNISIPENKIYIFLYDNLYILGYQGFNDYLKEKYDANLPWRDIKKLKENYDKNIIFTSKEKLPKNRYMKEKFKFMHSGENIKDVIKFWKLEDFVYDDKYKIFQKRK